MYVKIININDNGNIDYKGLNINCFISGKQIYDYNNNYCIVETTESISINNIDLFILTEEQYFQEKAIIETNNNQNKPLSLEEQIEGLKAKNNELQVSIIEAQNAINLLLGV